MLIFIAVKRALCGQLNFCAFRLLKSGLIGVASLIMFGASFNNAVAQFPGIGSEAPSGVATQSGDGGLSSNGAGADNSDSDDQVSNVAVSVSGSADDDTGSADYQSSDSGISISTNKKEQQRKQLFIKKLRLEFAAIELVERKTGLPFSRDEIPRYLAELRSDLEMTGAREEKGKILEGTIKSIARDAYYIETRLNQYLDQLLEHTGQIVPKRSLSMSMPALPKSSHVSRTKLDALSLKFAMAAYGEKALQAMGVKRN
jgi:hypothetical protein